MKKIIYKQRNQTYKIAYEFVSQKNSILSNLIESFHTYNAHIFVDLIDDDMVVFWDKYLEDEYDSFDDVPKLILSKENYNKIIDKWNQNILHPAEYLIVEMDELGTVKIVFRNKLYHEDIVFIESENNEKIKYYAQLKNKQS